MQTPTMLLQEMQEECKRDPELLAGTKAFYCNVKCEIGWIYVPDPNERQMFYLACPTCRKKIEDNGSEFWCKTCQTSGDALPVYNFSLKVQDFTGSQSIQCMGEAGESILGMEAVDLYDMHEDVELIRNLVREQVTMPYEMLIRAKVDQFGGID